MTLLASRRDIHIFVRYVVGYYCVYCYQYIYILFFFKDAFVNMSVHRILRDKTNEHVVSGDKRVSPLKKKASATSPASENCTNRLLVLQELCESEKRYVKRLEICVESYLKPLKPHAHPRTMERIFGNIEDLLNCNRRFLADLERIRPPAFQDFCIGKTVSLYSHFFRVYKQYCNYYGDAMVVLGKLCSKDPNFEKFLNRAERSSNHKLVDILITPIQRLVRLKLLLERIIKFTPETHADYRDLKVALMGVSEVADYVNKGIHEKESRLRVWEIQRMLVPTPPNLVEAHRHFIMEGYLTKVCRRTNKVRYFFLFNDVLVYGHRPSPTSDVVHFKQRIEFVRVTDLRNNGKNRHAFALMGRPKSFVVMASSSAEKRTWLKALDRCCEARLAARRTSMRVRRGGVVEIEEDVVDPEKEISPLSKGDGTDSNEQRAAPLWIPDRWSACCMVCAEKFGAFRRRHHCRNCGRLVCHSCSGSEKLLVHVDNTKPVRICDTCVSFYR